MYFKVFTLFVLSLVYMQATAAIVKRSAFLKPSFLPTTHFLNSASALSLADPQNAASVTQVGTATATGCACGNPGCSCGKTGCSCGKANCSCGNPGCSCGNAGCSCNSGNQDAACGSSTCNCGTCACNVPSLPPAQPLAAHYVGHIHAPYFLE